jgi:hypothetical protein
MEIDNNIVNNNGLNNRLNNIVNVYDEKKHNNIECQKNKRQLEKKLRLFKR